MLYLTSSFIPEMFIKHLLCASIAHIREQKRQRSLPSGNCILEGGGRQQTINVNTNNKRNT